MEFRKREIKRPEPPTKETTKPQSNQEGGMQVMAPPSIQTPKVGDMKVENVGKVDQNMPELIPVKFLIVEVSAEMFEYGQLRTIEYRGNAACADRNFDQRSRVARFAYRMDESVEESTREVIEYWTNELEAISKQGAFQIKTVNLPKPKEQPNDSTEVQENTGTEEQSDS